MKRLPFLLGLLALLAVAFALTARVLFATPPLVLSHISNDLANYFYPVRAFAAERLRAGDIPFFNPHVLSGVPFVGGFQSAVFYPGHLLFLALPLESAINVSIVLHMFLAGAFVLVAAHRRRVGMPAATIAGLVFLLGGPFFPHLWAGHLSLLWTAPWAILGLTAVDAMLAGGGARWMVTGAFAMALGLLAGHPQTMFHAVVAAMIWIALRWPEARNRRGSLMALAASALLGIGMASVQWWPALAEAPYGLRNSLSSDEAALFSLPPESLISVVASGFFGAGPDAPYWGRGYFWEMSLFIGAATLPLVLLGATVPGRGRRTALAAVLVILLALGANGPFYGILQPLPGFNRIRGWSKFTIPLLFLVAMLAAEGAARLQQARIRARWIVWLLLGAVVLLVAGFSLRKTSEAGEPPALFLRAVATVQDAATVRHENYLAAEVRENVQFLTDSAARAGSSLFRAGTFLAAGVLLLFVARRWPAASAPAFLVLVALELVTAARPLVTSFDPEPLRFRALDELLASRAGDGRILNTILPNSAMTIGAYDIGGYEPAIPRRTAEFLEFSQGRSPDRPTQFPQILTIPNMFAMLRFELGLALDEGRLTALPATIPAMPRVALFERFEVLVPRDSLLVRFADPDFDFRQVVLLEESPDPLPQAGGAAGRVRVVEDRGDHVILEASVPAPALLLMTDAYHPFWTAEALSGSAQESYKVLPADHMLRAIPLAAGDHSIALAYRVPGFPVAVGVSLISLAVAAGLAFARRRRDVTESV